MSSSSLTETINSFTFTIDDNGDPKRAQSRSFYVGVRYTHEDGKECEVMRKIVYTNTCQTTSFFKTVHIAPLYTFSLTVGNTDIVTHNFGSLFPDYVSDGDKYSRCNAARVYTYEEPPGAASG